MSNIYFKVTVEIFVSRSNFWEDIVEFSNFVLQLKNRRSVNKTVCGFAMILSLKRIMTF